MTKQVDEWTAEIAKAQKLKRVEVFGATCDRVPYGDEPALQGWVLKPRCRDCGVALRQLHVPGCVVEACPRCKVGQAFGCPCGELH